MHTPLLIGIFAFFAAASSYLSVFFVRAWLVRQRDREYLIFGFLCASLAAHSVVTALIHARAVGMIVGPPFELLFRLVVVPSKAAIALALHFALRYARVKRAEAIAAPVYVLMGAFAVLGLSGGWWQRLGGPTSFTMFGLSLVRMDVKPTAAAQPFYLIVPIVVAACIWVFGRHYQLKRNGLGAWLGCIVLGVSVINDIGLGAGWFRSLPTFALGFMAFTYGVALTLVSRYARTASELQRSTESLQARSRELERSYSDLRRTQQELVRSEQLAVIGELAAVIAHEVRNPLAIVGNAVASLRKRDTTSGDRRTLLEIITEEMARLDQLVGRLIHYARPVVLDKQPVALEQIVQRSAKVVEGTGVRVTMETRGTIPDVEGDPTLLRQLFENVLTNAAQAGGTSKSIRARFARRNVGGVAVVAVEIQDDGDGMTPAQLESALTPFFTTRPTGTGLGLPIVARIVQAHGGQVQIDSDHGIGTTVTVLLPTSRSAKLQSTEDGKRLSLLP